MLSRYAVFIKGIDFVCIFRSSKSIRCTIITFNARRRRLRLRLLLLPTSLLFLLLEFFPFALDRPFRVRQNRRQRGFVRVVLRFLLRRFVHERFNGEFQRARTLEKRRMVKTIRTRNTLERTFIGAFWSTALREYFDTFTGGGEGDDRRDD